MGRYLEAERKLQKIVNDLNRKKILAKQAEQNYENKYNFELDKKFRVAQRALQESDSLKQFLNQPQSITVPKNTTALLYYNGNRDRYELKINQETRLEIHPEFVKDALKLNKSRQNKVNLIKKEHKKYKNWKDGLSGHDPLNFFMRSNDSPTYRYNNINLSQKQNLGLIFLTPNILKEAINVHNKKYEARMKLELAEQIKSLQSKFNNQQYLIENKVRTRQDVYNAERSRKSAQEKLNKIINEQMKKSLDQ